jgi:septum formation protein
MGERRLPGQNCRGDGPCASPDQFHESLLASTFEPPAINETWDLKMKLPPIILASESPRRVELLRRLAADFKIVPSDAPEIHQDQLTAGETVQINAYRKARTVAKKHPDALVLAADTLVNLESEVFGKPRNLEQAYEMLERLHGRTHLVITGVCLLNLRNHRQRLFTETTSVRFRKLDAVKIRRYLSKVNPLDKAGAYAIQEEGDALVESVSGSYSNVVGLPLERLKVELDSWKRETEMPNPAIAMLAERSLWATSPSQPAQFLP